MKTTLFHILFTILISDGLCHEREIVIAQWSKPGRGDEPGGFTCEDLEQRAAKFWKKRQFYDCHAMGHSDDMFLFKFKTNIDIWNREYRELDDDALLWLATRMVNDYEGNCRTVSEFLDSESTTPTETIMLTGLYQKKFCNQLMTRQFNGYKVTSCDFIKLREAELQTIQVSTYHVQLSVPADRHVVLDLISQLNNGLSKCRYNAYAVQHHAQQSYVFN
ncbi:hypothetical protein CRM22_000666 [Opisthorchis felineus]|uniref:Uncharacterized protein n=1 Tax=Opisthorchis felineus TaxID=147828 RepID=A0A4S2MDY8_OPIFE|nr:hypothetical protein CRM22_000666 [Opisthorchis felineus]